MRGLTGEPHQLDARIDGVKVWASTVGGRRPQSQRAASKPKADGESQQAASTPKSEAQGAAVVRAVETKPDDGLEFRLPVKAGSRLVQVYFVHQTAAFLEDLIDPISVRSLCRTTPPASRLSRA